YSNEAADYATIVKLTRAGMISPLCISLALLQARMESKAGNRINLVRIVPWFIEGFLLASDIRSIGMLPAMWLPHIQQVAFFLMVMALAAAGLPTPFRSIVKSGSNPLVLALGVWVAVSLSSLAFPYVGGNW